MTERPDSRFAIGADEVASWVIRDPDGARVLHWRRGLSLPLGDGGPPVEMPDAWAVRVGGADGALYVLMPAGSPSGDWWTPWRIGPDGRGRAGELTRGRELAATWCAIDAARDGGGPFVHRWEGEP